MNSSYFEISLEVHTIKLQVRAFYAKVMLLLHWEPWSPDLEVEVILSNSG